MKIKTASVFLAIATLLMLLSSASRAAEPLESPLWPGGAPGASGSSAFDIPTITPYPAAPGTATGSAMIIFPGGGYGGLAEHEGKGYACWFQEHGITAFVVKYRLGTHGYRHPAMLQDAARAVRWVRAHAANWGIDLKRVGVIGSSAGGHLASTILTHFDAGKADAPDPIDQFSSRPDLGILCYAVISMGPITHQGSRNNLLGPNPAPELVELLSNEKQVTAETPPCFIWHTWEDAGVKVENALAFAMALREKNVPFDLHIYQKGPHGIGLGKSATDPSQHHPWTGDCLYWLRCRGFVK